MRGHRPEGPFKSKRTWELSTSKHDPEVGEGSEAFIEYFTRIASECPGKGAGFKRAIAEGQYVVLHCCQAWPGDRDDAGRDVFRFDENGRIVEHWGVLQVIPVASANDNPVF